MSESDRTRSDELDAALREFVWDLFWVDDLGLSELTQMASKATGRPARDLIQWARTALSGLMESGSVRVSVTSWPSMTPERGLHSADLDMLADEDWYDASEATTLVVVEGVGEPPIARADRPWRFD